MKQDHLHGQSFKLRHPYENARYVHRVPFWRAVHAVGIALGGNEGGSSYQVGRDLYVLAHDGTDYYQFVVPFYFATEPREGGGMS